MNTIAKIKLWGTTIGAVELKDGTKTATFEYENDFLQSNIQVSPLMMPLSPKIYSFPSLAEESFNGLPGLLSDSLPDKFGNALIDAWLIEQDRLPESFNSIERLCYTGSRGMGALEFEPSTRPAIKESRNIQIEKLIELASDILTHRNSLQTNFSYPEKAMQNILKVGTSAGGARAKAVIAWNPQTNEIRSGQIKAGDGFEYWLLKFDGVSNNKDKELSDPEGYGSIEYAYYKMAIDCGITMSDCRLFEDAGRKHFMTRRFDRLSNGDKLHMQTLAAMAHFDFNQAGIYSYEQAFAVMRRLELPASDMTEQFRRMIFNVIARNQDDHVKNIAFLMNRRGQWSLSPAYDVTYSYQPTGRWTSSHQMSINGKRDGFTMDDFQECAKSTPVKPKAVKDIIEKTREVVSKWRNYAVQSSVSPDHRDRIYKTLRLEPFE